MTDIFAKNSNLPQLAYRAISCSIHKLNFFALAALLLVCFSGFGQPPTKTAPISLRAEPFPFTPKQFYIASIIDERENRNVIAYILPIIHTPEQLSVAQPVDLQGGGLTAIREFIRQSLNYNTALRPITIRLKQCLATESMGNNGRVEGRVVLTMAFELQREGKFIPLVEYKGGGARYERPVSQLVAIEHALRQSLVSALRFFNTWIESEAGKNEKLAKGLKVLFTDYTRNVEKDTVFYTPDRPLTWNDFRDKPRPGSFAASVFPGFAYEGHSEMVDGIIHIHVTMKVYVLKNSSWVRENARDTYGLNHEQRHFDIVKLVAERFKQKIHPDSLTIDNYNSIIQWDYIESFREMNRLQEQYDNETRHGLDRLVQERWNQRIDEELHIFEVKE